MGSEMCIRDRSIRPTKVIELTSTVNCPMPLKTTCTGLSSRDRGADEEEAVLVVVAVRLTIVFIRLSLNVGLTCLASNLPRLSRMRIVAIVDTHQVLMMHLVMIRSLIRLSCRCRRQW